VRAVAVLLVVLLSACGGQGRVQIWMHCGLGGVLLDQAEDGSWAYAGREGAWTFDETEVRERAEEWEAWGDEFVDVDVRSDGGGYVVIGPDGSRWKLVPRDRSLVYGCV
jgi:hypothetical protein